MTPYLFLFFIFIVFISILYSTLKNGIGPYPTSKKIKNDLLKNIPDIGPGTIIDLGSGWGTLSIPIANHYKYHSVIGYENSFFPYVFSQIRKIFSKNPRLKFKKIDFYTVDLKEATLVVCFLYPEAMRKLEHKFNEELNKGTWIITHTFAIHGWQPKKIVEVDDFYHTKIYFYEKS